MITYIRSEVISETVVIRSGIQISWILDVSFTPGVCLWFENLNYHSGTICEVKVKRGSCLT